MKNWPDFFVSRTLVGGPLDCNRRAIHRKSDDATVWMRKPTGSFGEWTAEDQKACDEALADLLANPDKAEMVQ